MEEEGESELTVRQAVVEKASFGDTTIAEGGSRKPFVETLTPIRRPLIHRFDILQVVRFVACVGDSANSARAVIRYL